MTIISTTPEIPRDDCGRPYVVTPEGKRTTYTRCTTYVGVLEDRFRLGLWEQRQVAVGLVDRPDLQLSVAAHRDDRDKLDSLCHEAREAAKSSAGSTIGTAVHKLTERLDRGLPLGQVPEAYRPDLNAYEDATAELTATHIEQFTVCDELKVGGTPDRIVEVDGRHYIADVKTGRIDYGTAKIAMQLAVYAHSVGYNVETNERFDLPPVDLSWGLVIHLPAGEGRCELVWVDIDTGWEGVQLAGHVRGWRRRDKFKTLTRPFVSSTSTSTTTKAPPVSGEVDTGHGGTPTLADRIAEAKSSDDLTNLWRNNAREWTSEHTELAKARKALLATNSI